MLDALAARTTVRERVALVVAHPDDETIAAGASLRLLPGMLLVHVTDGAPRRLDDAARLGFTTAAAYAAAREAELQAALAVAGVAPERIRLGVPDQEASLHMAGIAADLARALAAHGIQTVLSHAYEGGHPDHDATAHAVHAAARQSRLPVVEFAGYHARPEAGAAEGGASAAGASAAAWTVQRFLPGPPETRIDLGPAETAQKQAMLDCFATQAAILSAFAASVERFRPAPAYDFARPPHDGPLNYETWGWEMTGVRWRALAAEALACAS